MEAVEHAGSSDLPYIPFDILAPYLPTKTLRALACTSQNMSKKCDTPPWTKVFNLRGARRTTPGTILYNRANEKLVDLAQSSTASNYNHRFYEILFKDPYFDTNYSDRKGRTVLMHASRKSSVPLIKKLVENRANLNLYGPNEKSPLSHAIAAATFFKTPAAKFLENQNKTIECLTQLGANINHSASRNQENYLFYAINVRILSVIPTLLACGINPNHKRGDGMTPLGFMVKIFPHVRGTIPPQEIVDSTVVALMKAGANPYELFRNDREATINEICRQQNSALALLIENNLQGDADWYKNNGPKY
jgi:ankyrin repeat protein